MSSQEHVPPVRPVRHARQIRLREVGVTGQARIAAARAVVDGGAAPLSIDAARVAVRYLSGAGFGALRVGSPALADEAHAVDPSTRVEMAKATTTSTAGAGEQADARADDPFADLDPAARDVARGAAFALAEIRRALA